MAQTILIIDDDPDVVMALQMPLESVGYQIASAHTQAEGLAAVDAVRPDLIILDVMMDTHTAGFQLAQKLHGPGANPAHVGIPIIILTAVHQTTPLRFEPDSDYLPVQAFIEKPIDPAKLLAEVARLLKTE